VAALSVRATFCMANRGGPEGPAPTGYLSSNKNIADERSFSYLLKVSLVTLKAIAQTRLPYGSSTSALAGNRNEQGMQNESPRIEEKW